MLKQATEYLPDVPPPVVSEDVSTNYNGLMKALNNILINLQEIYVQEFHSYPEGEADYPYSEDGTEYGSEWETGSQASYNPSEVSYASIGSGRKKKAKKGSARPVRIPAPSARSESGSELTMESVPSVASAVSHPFYRARDVRSEPSSVYSQPVSSFGYSEDPLAGYENPFEEVGRKPYHPSYIPLLMNSLTREVVNAKFYVEALNFSQLTKLQKQSIRKILVRIDKPLRIIRNVREMKPITVSLGEVLSTINNNLVSEGSASMYIPRTEAEIPQEPIRELEAFAYGGGRICGSTTSMYGAARKHRLLSPAMYNLHNVNDNFAYSLAKRNR
jgi:hypothetical protein